MTSIVAPICVGCKHYVPNTLACSAFQGRIPDEIIESKFDHRMPYPGDNGQQFDPLTKDDAEYAGQIFGDLVHSS